MEASAVRGDDPVVVAMAGELDSSDPTWAEPLDDALAAGELRLVVDLLDVSFIDSSVVQALVSAHRTVGQDGWVRVVYTHHLIKRVIEICGLSEIFPQYTTVDAALRSSPSRLTTARAMHQGERP
ncbi:MAG: STAS domain-containing protein [Jatrophihabitans sp.]|uniref:STAS domain-containing protein n=1 Tax=Jatrophihabitans sp. TaxID=1932789 RepID=UPI003F7DDD33